MSLDDHRLPLELASMLACMLACMSLGMLDYSAQSQLESLQVVCAWFKRFKHVCLCCFNTQAVQACSSLSMLFQYSEGKLTAGMLAEVELSTPRGN